MATKRSTSSRRKVSARKARRGFLFPFLGNENFELGRKFLQDPKGVLKRANLKIDDLACPEDVHAALRRGERFSEEVRKFDTPKKTVDNIKAIERLAAKHFGRDFEVAAIPFGLKFQERLKHIKALDWTATGTGSVTFLDSDADVDG